MQQWRIRTFNDWNISDVAEALPQAFTMVAEIITTLTDFECFCALQIYIFFHDISAHGQISAPHKVFCIVIWNTLIKFDFCRA